MRCEVRQAYRAALAALAQLRDDLADPGIFCALEEGDAAVFSVDGEDADVARFLLEQIRRCHQRGAVYSPELGHALRVVSASLGPRPAEPAARSPAVR